ncbi:hypothetical protein [Hydrogenophaga electricum]|uniref:hypothetical protein n=1 Tax=Hydrogenophaga electricum TaxID=1230953 RepID=UPI0024E0AE76|nr:hypothetical protein [Hydrogenophaga electricum]
MFLAIPWLTALKVIPWGDVIEHAPKVLAAARQLVDRQNKRPAPSAADAATPIPVAPEPDVLQREVAALQQDVQRLQQTQDQLTRTVADLAEQNTRLVGAVDVLRRRTRLLLAVAAVLALGLVWLGWR